MYEAFGTAFLMITINWSLGNPHGITIGLFTSIVTLGWATGGHFNPAVTMGVLVKQTYSKGVCLKDNLLFAVSIIVS